MAKYKIYPAQLNALKNQIENTKKEVLENKNYNLDYVKFFVHPDLSDIVILKTRTHGISGGQPFDEIQYTFFDSKAQKIDFKKNFLDINAWFSFVDEMRQVNIVNGELVII
jgi:hypothetical protein